MPKVFSSAIFFIWIGMNFAIILIERGVELTNLYKDMSNNNYYSVLNGNNNHIIRKKYSSFRSLGIENIKYTLITVPNKEQDIFTDLQVLQIQTQLGDTNNKITTLPSSISKNTFDSMPTTGGLDNWEGDYIILDDSNPFATGGRLTESNGNPIGVVNLNINDLYEQSIKNRDGTIGFTLANDPNGRQINTIDNPSSTTTSTAIPPTPAPLPPNNSNYPTFINSLSSSPHSHNQYLQNSIFSLLLYIIVF